MSTVTLAANLRRIRHARGLTQGEVAARAGVSRVAYNAIEAGTSAARVDTISRIANALGVEASILLEATTLRAQVRFRAQKRLVRREDILSRVAKWLDDYCDLERLVGSGRSFPLDDLQRVGSRGEARARQAASDAREALGLSEGEAIRDVCGLLEDHGLKVGGLDLASEGFFGLSVGKDHGGPAIIVNIWSRISVERWIFTAIHELGHLVLHLRSYDVTEDSEDRAQESEADIFASYFLMPEDVFRQEWSEARGLPLVERVLKVKRIFRVSWKTVIYRAFPGDRRIWARFQVEYRSMTGRTLAGKEEPFRLSPFEFKLDGRDRLLRKALEEGKVDITRAADILGISTEEMEARRASWRE